MAELAYSYASAPVVCERDVHMWRQLATWNVRLANQIRRRLHVHETTAAEPYRTADDMGRDVRRGHFMVSTANSAHPVWSPRENAAFRIVHDVLGHCAPAGDILQHTYSFTWHGETYACREHARHVPRELWPALLTECLGQVAWSLVRGAFDVQKVATLDADHEAWFDYGRVPSALGAP